MEKMAWLLDGMLRVPGTRFRFGLDSIIGLVPGVGDVVGLLLGATILYESVRAGAPRALLVRMVGNAAADALGGLIPGIGDLFDFAFKSNQRNARLLMEHLDRVEARPALEAPRRGSAVPALLLVAGFLAATIGLLWLAWSWWLSR
ncbi:MAG: hypothetical protein K0Q76_3962 [Panacagrimonas sp.]|jgi:hypothetical protein|nr:DUF4112 domain-containing protein [Panacagrimonas sp.]MCC2658854.1 hypothetical protein [Panacagrimonas sp.]